MSKTIWGTLALLVNTLAVPKLLTQERSVLGDWSGAIAVAGTRLDMNVHLMTGDSGLVGTIDIPAQGATGIALTNVTYDDPRLHFELLAGPGRTAVFDGVHAGDSIGGEFGQSGITGMFHLLRSESDPPPVDTAAVPYDEVEVTFAHDTIRLAGTLTLPRSDAPVPAVVLISGSGAQNRDEELFGFQPFRMIADHLTRAGVAVLRYDDRGVGGSSGSVSASTTADFADDVLAAVEYLRARPDIAGGRIGLLGHSEGGLVAPIAATRSDDVAFIVLLAGTAVPGDRIIEEQAALIGRVGGASEEAIAANRDVQRALFRVARGEVSADSGEALLGNALRRSVATLDSTRQAAVPDVDAFITAQVRTQLTQGLTPWFRYFIDYDPYPTLTNLRTPVLAIFGDLDLQVPSALNAPVMRRAFEEGGHTDYTIRTLAGANHLFLRATTGSPSEYPTMEKVFVEDLLPLVTEWIAARTR